MLTKYGRGTYHYIPNCLAEECIEEFEAAMEQEWAKQCGQCGEELGEMYTELEQDDGTVVDLHSECIDAYRQAQ